MPEPDNNNVGGTSAELSRYINEELVQNIRQVERLTGINNYLKFLIQQKEEEHRQLMLCLQQQTRLDSSDHVQSDH